ncbi:MAG TPA: substrate-binding domain-containing protein [Methylomirabilota bacterium]|nr:substrate-binding domain-containing protein [Methylomirabilota bacterium]
MRVVALVLAGCLSTAPVSAAEVRVFCAGAVESGLVALSGAFTRETGNVVRLTAGVPAALRQRVEAGEAPDVLIAPPAVMDALVRAGKVKAEGRALVARVGVGVLVRKGAPLPDISSPERLKQTLLSAESLVYNRASTGTYFERLLDRLGVAEQVKAKAVRYADGVSVLEHVLRGTGREVGIGAITEIREYEPMGLTFVGPLPGELQNYTSYVAGVVTVAGDPDGGAAFIGFVTSPAAKTVFSATGAQ